MPRIGNERLLEKVGIDLNSNVMIVFKAILIAGGLTNAVTYKDIVAQLKQFSGIKYTRAYLYRLIKELEEDGFIIADAVQHPKQYSITTSSLTKAVNKKRQNTLSSLLSTRQQLSTQLNVIKTVNPQDLAITTYNTLKGISPIISSTIIEGVENVRSTVIREFAEVSKQGDVVRVLAPASLLDGGLDSAGLAEQKLVVRALDGVKVSGILMPQKHQEFTTELIVRYLRNMGEMFGALAATGNISMRIAKEYSTTYRMVSLNNEKMLLYLTHSSESDIAALIHRKDNPGLIDDAVKTFDNLFDEGINVVEVVEKMLLPGES